MDMFLAVVIVVAVLAVTIYAGIKLANVLNIKGYKCFLFVFFFVWLVAAISNSFLNPDFTGNPQKDGKILYERIYENNEDFDSVIRELEEYYLEEGYSMFEVKEAISICADIRANN